MAEILIVDDDKYARTEIRTFIEESKFRFLTIYEANTAQRGMTLLKQNRPSVLILDISLPDMDGIRFGRSALQLYSDLPVIVVTQLKMFEFVQEAINSGFSAYLLKPLSRNELYETLERILPMGLNREINQTINGNRNFSSDLKNPIESAIQFIQMNYGYSLTLKEVADQVYLSPSYFSRLFKEEVGMTFVEYLSFVRVQKAKSLLRFSSLPIEVIAHNTGFSNPGYFATTFKKIVGKTPSEYREQFYFQEKGVSRDCYKKRIGTL
ncbi:two-component response regulator [Geobacillus sp. GHH01]|uniref:response regulator transcription factor n=1 Tax=Geobacillus sp. GHH01 TaxID=1233873 RepID=UPI0002AF36F8|nr:helix-turn-helix domain-containing protein [Geobacillus sp. GHH01]AGE21890.1 two-component response regulator [Geobacillus sp. GHH01]